MIGRLKMVPALDDGLVHYREMTGEAASKSDGRNEASQRAG